MHSTLKSIVVQQWAYRGWHLVNRQELLTAGGRRGRRQRAEGLLAKETGGGHAAVSLMPDIRWHRSWFLVGTRCTSASMKVCNLKVYMCRTYCIYLLIFVVSKISPILYTTLYNVFFLMPFFKWRN